MTNSTDPIGAVFTPLDHAQQTIGQWGLYSKWREGALFLDPTAGSGNLIEAFLKTASDKGDDIPRSLLKNLYAVEMQKKFIKAFHLRIKKRYAVDFPEENYVEGDYLFSAPSIRADYLIGNPPWLNFCDLDESYKEKIKPLFLQSGLAVSKKDLLLGNSRIDIAALIVYESVRKNLKDGGRAYFYLPLSLFLNDGAHRKFREGLSNGRLSLDHIEDYRDLNLFADVSTRYGFASFTKGAVTRYPVLYRQPGSKSSPSLKASPLGDPGSPLFIHGENDRPAIPRIEIKQSSKPRQGLNTCGANKLFIFDRMTLRSDSLCLVENSETEALLPRDLVYPLIGSDQFKGRERHRYVFLPYGRKGKALTEEELSSYPEARAYLLRHRNRLENRKGVLIGSAIKKGLWWSLLGIGPYSFSSWKVVWEAYGKKEFRPKVFGSESDQPWQPNQALQAFLSFDTEEEARDAARSLADPLIEKILKSQGMEGTCNWAQPGRMMKFFDIRN